MQRTTIDIGTRTAGRLASAFQRPQASAASLAGRSLLALTALLVAWIGAASPALADSVPPAEHVIVVVMENKSYSQARTPPYTAGLIARSGSFSSSYAITHPSQPNYLALWSGDTQGSVDDQCPPPGSPFHAENLGHACEAAGIPWRSYCEDLPQAGWMGCSAFSGLYVRKHAPWTDFDNLSAANERPYSDLATDIAAGRLPRLAFVVPNQCDNTHDCPIDVGDAWLAANLPAMIGAVGPNGFVVLTWDEDDYGGGGNHILTVFCGPMVKSGYVSIRMIDHYTVLRTICDAIGLAAFGSATSKIPITDVWNPTASADGREVGAGTDTDPTAGPRLEAIGPNPVGGESAFRFRLVAGGGSSIAPAALVRDVSGRTIAAIPIEPRGTGAADIKWDGRLDDGRPASPGSYVISIRVDGREVTRKVVVLGR